MDPAISHLFLSGASVAGEKGVRQRSWFSDYLPSPLVTIARPDEHDSPMRVNRAQFPTTRWSLTFHLKEGVGG